jgi:D-glycero-alpha-D-manno-heptose-7-phosphate kinase
VVVGTFPKTRARAPLRLGFAGGGTDLSPYCDEYGGAVLNITSDRYAFATIALTENQICFEADDIDVSDAFHLDDDLSSAKLMLHRAVYERMIREFNQGRRIPLRIKTTVDAPPGSGLGSSSALVVALVDGMRAILGAPLGNYDVAHLAFEIERLDLGLSGGRQDQYAAAFGGINYMEFLSEDRVIVNSLRVDRNIRNELESSVVICFSGISRTSSTIIERQQDGIRAFNNETLSALHQLKTSAIEMKRSLLVGDIGSMAELLNGSWRAKRETADGVSNSRIDELVTLALENGALAGKVSGAGGGGFIFFIAHPESRHRLISALNRCDAQATGVQFSSRGSETWQL